MAAVSLLGTPNFSTTSGAKTVTATPAVGDLIVIFVQVAADSTFSAPTDDNSGGTYTIVGSVISRSTVIYGAWYVRDSLITSATSTIFSLANPGSDTGGGLAVIKVTGMSKSGSAAIRQYKSNNDTFGAAPTTLSWTSSKLTTNPVVGAVINTDNPAGIAPTASYSELLDTGYATPLCGIEIQKIDSGDTTNTMVWGSSSASGYACMGVELDASNTSNMFLLF